MEYGVWLRYLSFSGVVVSMATICTTFGRGFWCGAILQCGCYNKKSYDNKIDVARTCGDRDVTHRLLGG